MSPGRALRRGFTLLELVVTLGIILGLVCLASIPLLHAREQTQASTATVLNLWGTARTLARSNNGTGSGAIFVVRPSNGGSEISILANRPLPGYAPPQTAVRFPPTILPVPVTLNPGAVASFSLNISPSGVIDVVPSALSPGAAPLDAAPGCGSATQPNVRLHIGTPPRTRSLTLDCADGLLQPTSANG